MRSLDHCVLPTASLEKARARLSALGFTVAPDATHPFGTANCCVFFPDGTYLEPLAVADELRARVAAERGNTFVSRDRMYRERFGDEGFSAVALASRDAQADHARFVEIGLSAGPCLFFSRALADGRGGEDEASFRLAFAAPRHAECFFFTCERVKVPAVDRTFLQRHANGVTRLARILMTAQEPSGFTEFLSAFLDVDLPGEFTGGIEVNLANSAVSLLSPSLLRKVHGIEAEEQAGLRLRGLILQTRDLDAVRRRLTIAGIAFRVHEGRMVVPPASGQGAAFLFEESST
ncbi:VOC family protein [Chelativorans sp.]|uniref:VOC family protein n=1 Tax=Chelativorans sp. TaxID=2203393 RepID=UPI002810EDC5|nr:VOC family protein [Chelativorans sp.]